MERRYLKTHPWLRFHVSLSSAPPPLWILAGEARSKCDHIAGIPLQPHIAKDLHSIYLAKGIQATTAIEGNTLTLEEVRQRIAGTLKLPQSKQYLAKEIDNIVAACNDISDRIINGGDSRITPELLKRFNLQILDSLQLEQGVVGGEIRSNYNVGVGSYVGVAPEDVEFLVKKLCDWIESPDFQDNGETKIITALIKAIVFHVYLAWIHPFGDGNGRTARLVEVQILLAAGISTPAAHLLSNHYNQTRKRYYAELDKASKSGGDIIPFIQYAVEGFVDGLREQLSLIRDQQWKISWTDYVHEEFADSKTAAALRQKRLVLDLSLAGDVIVPISKIPEISPSLAHLYAKKTIRTIQRDVRELEKMKLIERKADGVRARREIILAFLPDHTDATPSLMPSSFQHAEPQNVIPLPNRQLSLPLTSAS
jgi:Fic family protein